jgi:hypothetical protein
LFDLENTVYWDGALAGEKEPSVRELFAITSVKTMRVDENGKPNTGQ